MKFLLTVFPGLSALAADEISSRLRLKVMSGGRVRGSDLIWVQTTDPAGLLEMRLVEDVFVETDSLKLTGKTSDLKALITALGRPAGLETALRAYTQITGKAVPARAQFRVVVQADDAKWRDFRRVDMQAAAEAGLGRAKPAWRLSPTEAPIEIWLHQLGRTLQVSLRITNGLHRSRGGRAVEREAALRPTIAAAMVWESRPEEEDVFLDPMCGSGTILLERASAGRHGLLLGGDIDAGAVKAAVSNFGPRHKPVRLQKLDARHLPLEDDSVDKFVTNLPWGRQIGRLEDLPALYKEVLREAVRVVRPGGRLVLLSGEGRLLKGVLAAQGGLRQERIIGGIEVLGLRADIYVLVRV